MNYRLLDTPIGTLRLVSDGTHLQRIEFEGHYDDTEPASESGDAVLSACATQLREYFAGKRDRFDLPLAAHGTEFQRQVWSALAAIPYGQLRCYRDIAEAIDKPRAVRAVGTANGRNQLPCGLPCQRVIGSGGAGTGFGGGWEA